MTALETRFHTICVSLLGSPRTTRLGGACIRTSMRLLCAAGLAASTSEAIRSIEQGGVKIDGEKVSDRALVVKRGTYVVQIGKRKWARVTVM